jgi:hypothetical protein
LKLGAIGRIRQLFSSLSPTALPSTGSTPPPPHPPRDTFSNQNPLTIIFPHGSTVSFFFLCSSDLLSALLSSLCFSSKNSSFSFLAPSHSELFEAIQAKELTWFKKLVAKSDLDLNAVLADDKEKVSLVGVIVP